MKTLKEIFYEIALNNIEGLTKSEAKHYLKNDALPSAGSVSGLIYNDEIDEIFYNHYDELIEILNGVYECIPLNKLDKSYLVWSAWELIILHNKENIKEILEIAEKEGILE